MAAPDYAGPLTGWRAWLVVASREGIRLASVLHDEIWPPRAPVVASCRRREDPFAEPCGRHAAPALDCGCGIHAAREREAAQPYLRGRDEPATLARVLGTVSVWGDVVEGTAGWRGAQAYPASIFLESSVAGLRDELLVYGVPVTVYA